MTNYIKNKELLRHTAQAIQEYNSKYSQSYSELVKEQEFLTKMAKRYGLIKEFKENGVI